MRLLLLSLLCLTACFPRTENTVESPSVLRSYTVPAHAAERLRPVLHDLMHVSFGKDSERFLGRAEVGPDGKLLVLAPESVQAGVSNLLATVTDKSFPTPGTIRLDYWVISGARGKSTEHGAELAEIAAALGEIEKNDGPTAFTLVEKLSVSSMENERGSIDGRDAKVRQRTQVESGQVIADVDIERFNQHVNARVRIKPGVVAVLASAGMTSKEPADANRSVYFLVRARNDGGQ